MKIKILVFCLLLILVVTRCTPYEEALKSPLENEQKNPIALSGIAISGYDAMVLSDQPLAFWNAASGNDLANGHTGAMPNGASSNLKSFFQDGIGKVAVYDYELSETSALEHARKMFDE